MGLCTQPLVEMLDYHPVLASAQELTWNRWTQAGSWERQCLGRHEDIPKKGATLRGPGASGAGEMAQLVECLLSIYYALGSISALHEPDVVAYTW